MRRTVTRAEAQAFDRVAQDYHRMGELNENLWVDPWLERQLPPSGLRALDLGCGTGKQAVLLADRFAHVDAVDLSGAMIELARARRPRPNISYREADLHEAGGDGRYDFVFSAMTLHHVPDLHAALTHIRTLVAPGGRAALADLYVPSLSSPEWIARRMVDRILPRRPRLHAVAAWLLASSLARRRGLAEAWEIYRLRTRREWLDHMVSDRFFTRAELERSCQAVFPGYHFDILGSERFIGLVWDAPGIPAGHVSAEADLHD
jgi:ubiquinone/menaquinone biosynthesis C-methylase UbiE